MKYKYDIVRSARKSISVSISSDNKITVRCPWGLPAEKIEKFLNGKSSWIEKTVTVNAMRLASNDDVIEYRQIYFNGVKLPLVIADNNRITPQAVYVKNKGEIEKLYSSACSEEFIKRVYQIAATAKLHPSSVSVKKYRGRWGCCDAKDNLVFNFMLFMLPPEIQHYVIVHELCHTLCHNHSAAFWKLVSDYEPQYKTLKKRLAAYDFLTLLY